MAKICKSCNNKIGFTDKKLPFLNKDNNKEYLHIGCYENFPKVEKKKLEYLGEPVVKFKPQGLVFGVVGGFGYSEGHVKGVKWGLLRKLRKNGYSEKQVNDKSIDMYNAHFGALDEKGMDAVAEGLLKTKK